MSFPIRNYPKSEPEIKELHNNSTGRPLNCARAKQPNVYAKKKTIHSVVLKFDKLHLKAEPEIKEIRSQQMGKPLTGAWAKRLDFSKIREKEAPPVEVELPVDQFHEFSLESKKNEKKSKVNVSVEQGSIQSKVIQVFDNVHRDDIHTLFRLNNNSFITGSKDGGLKKWKADGSSSEAQVLMEGNEYDYRFWVTSASPVNDNLWMHGTRDGVINLWETEGKWQKEMFPATPPLQARCKSRNFYRISYLSAPHSTSVGNNFLLGQACGFRIYDFETEKEISSCKTSENDWVYCIHPLNVRKYLIVTGTRLQVWEQSIRGNWNEQATIIDEPHGRQGNQRPYISATKQLQGYSNNFGSSVFDGSVRVHDLITKKEIFRGEEHIGRVWTLENLATNVFASCADDATIKIWDIRRKGSVLSLKDDLGRVSVLLNVGNYTLVSGSCPKNLRTAKTRARLTFYDIRG